MDLKSLVDPIVALAEDAGRAILEVYSTDFHVQSKDDESPLTQADLASHRWIEAGLRSLTPDIPIISEESGLPDFEERGAWKKYWLIDPLDGTKEFVARNGEFAVMMGLAIDGASVLGVVYQPVTDKLYAGIVGQGATLEQHGVSRELRVSEVADPQKLRLVVSRSHRNRAVDRVVSKLGIKEEKQTGSVGLKAGLIAERQADVYLHISDKSSMWDACGPEAVLRAAGGRFTDMAGNPYHYGGTDMRNRSGILACNAAAFDAVLPVAKKAARAIGLIE